MSTTTFCVYNSTRESFGVRFLILKCLYGMKCPDYGGVLISEGVVLCTGFNGVELGAEDVSLLERCPLLGTSYITYYCITPLFELEQEMNRTTLRSENCCHDSLR